MVRHRGFSLAEIGMAVAILVTVGSAVGVTGGVVMKQAKNQELVEQVKDLQQAIERWGEHALASHPTGNISVVAPYRSDPTQTNLFFNPYTQNAGQMIVHKDVANASYPATLGSFLPADYGTTLSPAVWKGTIIYFRKAAGATYFKVWNGTTDVNFRSYALQALDDRALPLVTIGR